MYKKYNPKDKESIYKYAQELKGKTFKNICDEDKYFLTEVSKDVSEEEYMKSLENRNRKGGLGELLEERYFHYKADNLSEADFSDAQVELKVTPYKINKNGTLSAKERLIISMINYLKIIDMDFYTSNAWEKLRNVLLVYYLWDPEIEDRLDYIINYIYMFSPEGEDLRIIENDFYKIRQKVISGKAHELSEGDTLYLGAATKSSDSKKRTTQPNSEILAKPRAFSLKTSYMTYVLRNYITGGSEREDRILKNNEVLEFEDYVINKINQYKNIKDTDLFKMFFDNENIDYKNRYNRLALEILGVKTKNAEEFEKANIEIKAVRIEPSKKIRESMSFPAFKARELIEQSWEESDVYNYFAQTKFLFVIYQKVGNNYYLKGAKFWNMPESDIEGHLREEWERAVNVFRQGVKFIIKEQDSLIRNNLPKKSNTNILHVRPHAQKAAHVINGLKYGKGEVERDTDILPDGNRMTKQCFWLNNDYVLKQIEDEIK